MPVSIRDVAKTAGVSLATVSKVLNNAVGAQISEEKRERVRRAAAELGYRPSAIARALVRKQIDTIGIVLPPGSNSPVRVPFFGSLIDGIFQAAAQQGQNTMVFTGHSWVDRATSLSLYQDGRCDGLLVLYQPAKSEIVPALLDARIPTVLINDPWDDPRVSLVDVDNIQGGREATTFLLGLGHTRIGYIHGSTADSWAVARLQGYQEALQAAGVPFDSCLVPRMEGNLSSWDASGHQLLALLSLPPGVRPTALFCANDELAARCLQILAQRGIRVPEEMSIVGFNDDATADRHSPPLTTMRQPYELLGERAVHLLLQQVRDIENRGRIEVLPPQLIVRASATSPGCPRPQEAEHIT